MKDDRKDDFRFWAKCPKCCKTGLGVKVGPYFSCAYTEKQWKRNPICVNCETPMQYIYEVVYDD